MSEVPVSPVGNIRPYITIETAPINSEPAELDGTPTSPDQVKVKDRNHRVGSTAGESTSSAASGGGLTQQDREVGFVFL